MSSRSAPNQSSARTQPAADFTATNAATSPDAASKSPEAARRQTSHGVIPSNVVSKPSVPANSEGLLAGDAVDLLISPQTTFEQKQATWKRVVKSGHLDEVISDLERRMTADPNSAEYPAELGQAYLKKCATLDDVREKGLLALQADKLFETSLSLDPVNWEARFTKAVGLSYWPASLNKGTEVVQQFQTLLDQQNGETSQPQFADTYLRFGEYYQRSGRTEDARAVWEKGATVFPSSEELQKKLAEVNAPQTATGATGQ